MDLIAIRKIILTAVAADDYLVEQLVLKGGNALELIHRVGARASIDLDFSMAADFDDPSEVSARLRRSLVDRFDAARYLVFDFVFGPRPTDRKPGTPWGGYSASFKLIPRALAEKLAGAVEDMRRQSDAVGPSQLRSFKIEISAYEYVDGRVKADVDDYTCYVYSLDMIAAEKLRAICQQSPDYPLRAHPTARARDFYDIHAAIIEGGVSFRNDGFHILILEVFRAKNVELSLVGTIHEHREFHRQEWPSVQIAVRKELKDFDYYFDYVVEETRCLEPLWVVQPPT
jgi:uncharacterized protein YneR